MNKFAKEIYYFTLPYLNDRGKPIETITEYNHYNMDLINQNRDHILRFFESHFSLHLGSFRADELLCDKEGKRWTNLDDLLELKTFEMVFGLGIAVGLIKDSVIDRFRSVKSMGLYVMYLNKEEYSFDNQMFTKIYLDLLRDYCLHFYIFNIDCKVYEYMNCIVGNNPLDDSQEVIKDKIIAWIKNSNIEVSENDIKTVTRLMEESFDKFINCVVTAFDASDGAAALIITLRIDPEFNAMEQIDNLISKYTESQLKDLDNRKKIFFDKIKITSDRGRKLK